MLTVEVTENQLNGDDTCISIGDVAYPIHNITCIKREVIASDLQGETNDSTDGA